MQILFANTFADRAERIVFTFGASRKVYQSKFSSCWGSDSQFCMIDPVDQVDPVDPVVPVDLVDPVDPVEPVDLVDP